MKKNLVLVFEMILIGIITFLLCYTDVFYSLDSLYKDKLYQQPRVVDSTIKIIAIDEKTLEALGPFGTWPRSTYAEVLDVLGDYPAVIGFDIMLLALELYSKDPHQRITSQLYPAVSAACNGTVTQVEKAIRDSIESAWKERNEPIWRMYFTPARSGSIPKPTNGEFLARVSAQLSCRYDYKRLERKSS